MGESSDARRDRFSDLTLTPAGLRIIKLLVGTRPQTVAEMIRATGVTRTAVTEQLHELVAAGLVERTTERLPGRGRPRHLYTATHAALLLLFVANQRMVVPAMWRAIVEIGHFQSSTCFIDTGDHLTIVLDRSDQIADSQEVSTFDTSIF